MLLLFYYEYFYIKHIFFLYIFFIYEENNEKTARNASEILFLVFKEDKIKKTVEKVLKLEKLIFYCLINTKQNE